MESFLTNFGLFAIFFAIVYSYKKILEYRDLKRLGFYEDERVYQAAAEFARGAPSDEVQTVLESCFEFDPQSAGSVLSEMEPHRSDRDGGYRAFIRSVNRTLGEDVYDEKHRMK